MGETTKNDRFKIVGDELNTKDEQLPRSKDGTSLKANEDDSIQLVAALRCKETSNKTSLTALPKEWFLADT